MKNKAPQRTEAERQAIRDAADAFNQAAIAKYAAENPPRSAGQLLRDVIAYANLHSHPDGTSRESVNVRDIGDSFGGYNVDESGMQNELLQPSEYHLLKPYVVDGTVLISTLEKALSEAE